MDKKEALILLDEVINFYLEEHGVGDEYENEGLREKIEEMEKYIEDNLE